MKVKIRIGNEVKEYAGAWEDRTLLEVFQELGITQVHAPCGGNGTCKKCLVTVEGTGEVLSCQTQCKDGMCVTVAEEQKSAIAENGNCYLYPADAGDGCWRPAISERPLWYVICWMEQPECVSVQSAHRMHSAVLAQMSSPGSRHLWTAVWINCRVPLWIRSMVCWCS